MSDNPDVPDFQALTGEEIAARGYNEILVHIFQHLYETALCMTGSDEAIDEGVYVELMDKKKRVWTLSVIPEDGGKVQAAMLERALEDDQ